jgi:GTPase SAR1 family protein
MASKISKQFVQTVMNGCSYTCALFFFSRHIRLYADSSEIIERFARVYVRFIDKNPGDIDISFCIVRSSAHTRSPSLIVEHWLYELPDTDRYIEHAELIVFRHLLEQLDDYIILHAGVVSRKGRAIVMYGQSGFGKTTLTLELLRRGYDFMSDEFCPIRLSDFFIEPFERLIGLNRSSPFYSLADPKQRVLLASAGKNFVDCADIFPYKPVEPCRAVIFIEISGTKDLQTCPPGGLALDINMCSDSTTVPDALRRLPGVIISGPLMKRSYAAYRVTASDSTEFMCSFNQIWKENYHDIFSVFPYKGEIDTYDRTPVLRSVPAFEALTSLVSNIVNRSPTGRLIASHGGKTSSLVMLLGALLKGAACYSLQPGHLAKMADLIDNLKECTDA